MKQFMNIKHGWLVPKTNVKTDGKVLESPVLDGVGLWVENK